MKPLTNLYEIMEYLKNTNTTQEIQRVDIALDVIRGFEMDATIFSFYDMLLIYAHATRLHGVNTESKIILLQQLNYIVDTGE